MKTEQCGVCWRFNVDIDKQNGSPSISGMKVFCDQLLEAIK